MTTRNAHRLAAFVLLIAAWPLVVMAQPPFGFGGGDRGSDRGSDWGRGRGGPPGGFDPSSLIERLDLNGNGMIDTDEMAGPARFMIERMARDNPKIDPSKPVSLDTLRKGFEKMREQRSSGGSDSGRDRRSYEDDRRKVDEAMEVKTLVPGFDPPETPSPVLGFGSASELFSVPVTPADEQMAKERMARYDRNRNGYLDKEELSSQWSGNPMDFDRNGDGRLSPSELAVRYAKRRVVEQDVREQRDRRQRKDDSRRRRDEGEAEDPFGGRSSYRRVPAESSDGLPGWFAQRDADRDGQVLMAEYAAQWNDQLIQEYFRFDLNRDGSVTAAECLAAVEQGATAGTGFAMDSNQASGGDRYGSSSDDRDRDGHDRDSRDRKERKSKYSESRSSMTSTSSGSSGGGDLDEVYINYGKRLIATNDKNKDGVLTPSEWKVMLIDPSGADANKDSRITIEEYARWAQSRARK